MIYASTSFSIAWVMYANNRGLSIIFILLSVPGVVRFIDRLPITCRAQPSMCCKYTHWSNTFACHVFKQSHGFYPNSSTRIPSMVMLDFWVRLHWKSSILWNTLQRPGSSGLWTQHSLRKQGGISSVTLHFSSFILSSSASADLIWFAETNWEIMRPRVVIYSGGIWRRQCGDSTASYEFGSNWSCWIGPNGWKVMSMASKSLIYASKNTKKFQHF